MRSGRILPDAAYLAGLERLQLPRPPDWVPAGNATLSSIEDLRAEFARVTQTPPRVHAVRRQFLRPAQDWMTEYRDWYARLYAQLDIEFVDSLWDCDDYASCFVAFADFLAMRAGESRAAFCIGWASVFQRNAFGGVRRGGRHAVVIVGTSEGMVVIEPQTGVAVPLARYPNRHTIEAVYF